MYLLRWWCSVSPTHSMCIYTFPPTCTLWFCTTREGINEYEDRSNNIGLEQLNLKALCIHT